jgi:hypothetical protein
MQSFSEMFMGIAPGIFAYVPPCLFMFELG